MDPFRLAASVSPYLLLTGGIQRSDPKGREEWQMYKAGLILQCETSSGAVVARKEYRSRPDCCPEESPSILLKASHVEADLLYACSSTELLIFSLPSLELVRHISHLSMNDIHHVVPSPQGTVYFANTGLDMVGEITMNGRLLAAMSTTDEEVWDRFDSEVDYRRVPTTKPHRSHPNHLFFLNDRLWVTRFEQRDAVDVATHSARIDIDVQRPHDGLVRGDFVYFTTVDGRVVIANADTRAVEEIVDLNRIDERDCELGWCRGLLVHGRLAWVGFSRIRPTRFRENVSWVRHGGRPVSLPTRISCYDLEGMTLLGERDLEPEGMNAVFSILEWPGA